MVVNVDSLEVWDLSLQIGDKTFRISEPTLDTLAKLQVPADDGGNMPAVVGQMNEMIDGEKPDWNSVSFGSIAAAWMAIETYSREYTQKKSEAARTAVRQAIHAAPKA